MQRARVATWPRLAALIAEAAAAGPHRPAIVGPDGQLSYAELTDLVADAAPAPEPAVLRVPTSIAGARAVLSAFAARQPVLLLDPALTGAEQASAEADFRAAVTTGDPVHAVATSGSTGRPKVVLSPYDGMLTVRRARRLDVARALADRLSLHKIPTRVVQLDTLPRAANGKLRRTELPR